MNPSDDADQRAAAIFDALDESEAQEQAMEAAAIEDQARRMQRIRERVDQDHAR